MYCIVASNQIVAYINEGSSFELSGVQYPSDWLLKCAPGWPEQNGLLRLVIVGDNTPSPFYQIEYTDSVIAGVPTRTYTRTPKPLADCKAFLSDQVFNIRWQKRNGGFTWNGMNVKTDETSLTSMTGAVSLFDKDPTLTAVEWDTGGGNFVTLDKATMTALAVAAGLWVQSVYSASKTILTNIAALTTVAQCEAFNVNAGWPS